MALTKVHSIDGDSDETWGGLALFKDEKGVYWTSDEYGTHRASKKLLIQLGIIKNEEHYKINF